MKFKVFLILCITLIVGFLGSYYTRTSSISSAEGATQPAAAGQLEDREFENTFASDEDQENEFALNAQNVDRPHQKNLQNGAPVGAPADIQDPRGYLDDIFRRLPRKDANDHSAQDDATGIPDSLISASQEVSQVEEQIEQQILPMAEGLSFFDKCVLDADLAPALRSLCYYHLKQHKPDHPSLTGAGVPQSISEPADSLIQGE